MLERLNKEVERRAWVAGVFPNEASLHRPVGAILMEVDQEWQTGKRYLNMAVEGETFISEQKKGIYRKKVA